MLTYSEKRDEAAPRSRFHQEYAFVTSFQNHLLAISANFHRIELKLMQKLEIIKVMGKSHS
jgi:uncharacterized HAD superfamily protein